MLYSQLLGRSSKTAGQKLTIKSHRLLVQAGYIRESRAGRYYFLPLGRRVQLKLMAFIRQEMDKAGGLEMVAPILHPLELWQETNRQNEAGFELMQVRDRQGSRFALGGTAEEMMVDLVRGFNLSYRDLPLNIYQFGLKFRDELRARGGLLRVREFIMKDAYTFSTPQQFEGVYQKMSQTYQTIFERIGLKTKKVAADGGYIGGEYCHEFIVDSAVGESLYFQTEKGYLAHEDVASFDKTLPTAQTQLQPLKQVEVQRGPTMQDSLQAHQPIALTQHLKNVVYVNEKKQIVVACLRGDLTVNEVKLHKIVDCHQLTPLTDIQIKTWLNSVPGFISPVGLKIQNDQYQLLIVADDSLTTTNNFVSGANQLNCDYVNINLKRDFKADLIGDIALAKEGYRASDGQTLSSAKGIEVGNIFQLGYHYSAKMKGATYTDSQGRPQKYYMGCYGIGIGRTIAAVAEVKSDDQGLIWPFVLAPYHIYLMTVGKDDQSLKIALDLKKSLEDDSFEVLYDDRQNVSIGEKLINADFIGLPIRIVISPKNLANNQVEIKRRPDQEVHLVDLDQVSQQLKILLRE